MKIFEILEIQPTLQTIMEMKMPGKISYAIMKNFKKLKDEVEIYDQARIKLLSDNWELDPKTNRYDIPDKDQNRWNEMHKSLLEMEVNIDPFYISEELIQSVEFSPAQMLALSFMVQDNSESVNKNIPKKKRTKIKEGD